MFPSDYLNVRKLREKANPYVELPTPEGNRRKQAVWVRSGPGVDLPNDTRQYNVNNYHVPSLKKNVSSTVSRREEGIFCVSCKQEHDFNDNKPFVVFITDQNFPPSLPADKNRCCVVLRLEDCLLSEQPGVLKEFFGNRTGYLPEGSAVFWLAKPPGFEGTRNIRRRGCKDVSRFLKYAVQWLQRSTYSAPPSWWNRIGERNS
jgi:hypothetical protein